MNNIIFKTTILAAAVLVTSCAHKPAKVESTKTQAGPKNIILMVSDGIGFNGWLAADYYQGQAGVQSYQVARPDGTAPIVLGLAHSALNLIDDKGNVLPKGAAPAKISGAVEQGYDPEMRWQQFANAMNNDFTSVGSYTSYTDSAAAGTALMSGRKTSVGRINTDWSNTESFETVAQIAMKQGKAAGVVTSVMVSHATPAAAIAHNVSRNNYADIFNEMLATELSVIMGAGHPLYNASGESKTTKQDSDYKFLGGQKTFNNLQNNQTPEIAYIDTKAQFESLAKGVNVPQRVVGIARSDSTLQASRQGLGSGNTPQVWRLIVMCQI